MTRATLSAASPWHSARLEEVGPLAHRRRWWGGGEGQHSKSSHSSLLCEVGVIRTLVLQVRQPGHREVE